MSPKNSHSETLEQKDSFELESESFLPSTGYESLRSQRRSYSQKLWSVCAYLLTFLAGVIVSGLAFRVTHHRSVPTSYSILSPIPHKLGIPHITQQINASDLHPSVFLGKPSEELDKAWSSIEQYNVFPVTEEDIQASGNGPDSIKLPAELTKGREGEYMATAEFIYHLHCLNFLRKATYFNYEHYKDDRQFHDPVVSAELRIGHCIDMLRQILMCKADTTITPYYWTEGYPIPFPNWNTWHQCSNFNGLMSWTREKSVKLPKAWSDWRQEEHKEFAEWPEPDHHVLEGVVVDESGVSAVLP